MNLWRATVLPAVIILALFLPASSSAQEFKPFAVVELFTSEGCSSCPPADAILRDLKKQSDKKNLRLYTLGFHVDYWDYLGWKDPLSSPAFSQRQKDYSKALGANRLYTPQMIVNGQDEFEGYLGKKARASVNKALKTPSKAELVLEIVEREKSITRIKYACQRAPAQSLLRLALVEDEVNSNILRGENAGRALTHANAVRLFQTIPLITEHIGTVELKHPSHTNLSKTSIIGYIQDPISMQIIGAEMVKY